MGRYKRRGLKFVKRPQLKSRNKFGFQEFVFFTNRRVISYLRWKTHNESDDKIASVLSGAPKNVPVSHQKVHKNCLSCLWSSGIFLWDRGTIFWESHFILKLMREAKLAELKGRIFDQNQSKWASKCVLIGNIGELYIGNHFHIKWLWLTTVP